MRLGLLRGGDWLGMATLSIGLASPADGAGGGQQGPSVRVGVHRPAGRGVGGAAGAVRVDRADHQAASARSAAAGAGGISGWGRIGSVILGMALYGSVFPGAASICRRCRGIFGAGGDGAGLVRAAAAGPDPAGAATVAQHRCAADGGGGAVSVAASCFFNTNISPHYSGPQSLIPNIVRAIGQALVMTPLTVLSNRRD